MAAIQRHIPARPPVRARVSGVRASHQASGVPISNSNRVTTLARLERQPDGLQVILQHYKIRVQRKREGKMA